MGEQPPPGEVATSDAGWHRLSHRGRVLAGAALIVGAMALDMAGGWVVRTFDWPLFLDSIGTVIAGAILGPVAGAFTGAASNILTALLLGHTQALAFAITAAFIGWAAAFAASRGAFRAWWRAAIAGALTGIGAALISAPIEAYVFGRPTATGMGYATQLLHGTGANALQVATVEGLVADPLDKTITFVLAWALMLLLRRRAPTPGTGFTATAELSGYTAGVLSSLLAATVMVVFRPALGDSTILVFFLAVLISALAGGRGPGLLTVVVGITVGVVTMSGILGGAPGDPLSWIGIALFAVIATIMVFVIDDRERGRRELADTNERLQRTSARLLAITHSVQEGLLVVDADGGALAANRHFYELFALPPDDVDAHLLASLRADVDRLFADGPALMEFMAASLPDQAQVFTAQAAQRWPVPRELVVISSPVIAEEDGYIGRLFVFRDVTRERQSEREKNEFFSAVSHELRTPLTAIKGYSEMILDGDAGDVNDEALEYVGVVHSNSERLVALVNDLLDFQRMDSGRVSLHSEPVDLVDAVGHVTGTMARLIESKSQTCTTVIDPAARWVRGDADKIVQVLTNYLSNAYKYSPRGAEITVGATTDGRTARVEVTDTGMGISAADQELLFTKFYRVDNSATREIGGTGLGLSIVKQIARAQGGDVGVRSEPGRGSTFWFTVPLLDGEPSQGPTPQPGRNATHDPGATSGSPG